MQIRAVKGLILIILSKLLSTFALIQSLNPNWLTQDFIEDINAKTVSRWRAERNLFIDYSEDQLERIASLRGYHPSSTFIAHTRRHEDINSSTIPERFDARDNWPHCGSIGTIRNQGLCGGDWAFAAAEVMTDRLCIVTDGMTQPIFSAEELITCCPFCGFGCGGGYLFPPFEYWRFNGIPSGGDQDSEEGCKPFSAMNGHTPACRGNCIPGYNKTLEEDRRHGTAAYHVDTDQVQIQVEIMKHGPVVGSIVVYRDFYGYKEGVYDHVSWEIVGHLAVKIIGWGVENGLPYWLVATSWGTNFGNRGFVKILRGTNQCGIEYEVTAGVPNIFE